MEESMNKMTFAYQSYNKEFECFNPNAHPEDWMIDGVKTVPHTHGGQFFKWESLNYDYSLVDKLSYQELLEMGAEPTKQEYLEWLVNFRHLNTIPSGQKYIYHISVHQIRYFLLNEYIGFDFISPRVIQDVKNGVAKIVILFPYEGNTSIVPATVQGSQVNRGVLIVDEWCKRAGLQKDQVYFIHGNLLADHYNSLVTNYTSMSVDSFTTWLPRDYMISDSVPPEFAPVDDKHVYLCYNRTVRIHRKFLLSMLEHKNLFEKGLISCGDPVVFEHISYDLGRYGLEYLLPAAKSMVNKIPIEIDMNLRINNPAVDINESHYARSFISLIPETHYENDILFRSEKIWKTLAVGHPFIVLSSSGFLASLKQLGFKTFDKWIDESYDYEPDWIKRMDMATDEIKRLSSLSIDRLREIRNEMKDVVLHNKNLCKAIYDRDMEYNGSAPLYRRVEQIWDSF